MLPLQKQIEPEAVMIVEEDRLPRVAAKDHVINGSRIMDTGFACHAGKITENVRKSILTPEIHSEIQRFLQRDNASGCR